MSKKGALAKYMAGIKSKPGLQKLSNKEMKELRMEEKLKKILNRIRKNKPKSTDEETKNQLIKKLGIKSIEYDPCNKTYEFKYKFRLLK